MTRLISNTINTIPPKPLAENDLRTPAGLSEAVWRRSTQARNQAAAAAVEAAVRLRIPKLPSAPYRTMASRAGYAETIPETISELQALEIRIASYFSPDADVLVDRHSKTERALLQDLIDLQSIDARMRYLSLELAARLADANARLTAADAMEDAHKTWEFLRRKFGRRKVAVSTGRTSRSGLLGTSWADRVAIGDMQRLKEGEFYLLMESALVKARAFHLGDHWTTRISANKFLPGRGPRDRAPGLEQANDAGFMAAYEAIGIRFLDPRELEDRASACPFAPDDTLATIIRDAGERIEKLDLGERTSSEIRDSFQLAMLLAAEADAEIEEVDPDPEPEPYDFGWD